MKQVDSYPAIVYKCNICNKRNTARFNLENPFLIAHKCKCGSVYHGENPISAVLEYYCDDCGRENTVKPMKSQHNSDKIMVDDTSENWKGIEEPDSYIRQRIFHMQQKCKFCESEFILIPPGAEPQNV